MHKLDIAPIFIFLIVTALGSLNAALGVIGGILSITYSSIKIYEHYKEKKKNSTIFKGRNN